MESARVGEHSPNPHLVFVTVVDPNRPHLPLTAHVARQILKSVHYRDWVFEVTEEADFSLRVSFDAACSSGLGVVRQHGRKWRLSPHMTASELVQTAFLAVMTAEEHEIRESFLYRDQAIFGPHFDVDTLASIAACKAFDVRHHHPTR